MIDIDGFNYSSILKFIENNHPYGWSVKKFDYIAEKKKKLYILLLKKPFLSKFAPSLFVYEVIFIFEKENL